MFLWLPSFGFVERLVSCLLLEFISSVCLWACEPVVLGMCTLLGDKFSLFRIGVRMAVGQGYLPDADRNHEDPVLGCAAFLGSTRSQECPTWDRYWGGTDGLIYELRCVHTPGEQVFSGGIGVWNPVAKGQLQGTDGNQKDPVQGLNSIFVSFSTQC